MDISNLVGTTLGNYKIEGLLGKGGMCVVYKARQLSLDRPVALKILPPSLSSDSFFLKRFQREAHAVAKLDHPNIIKIHDISESKGLHFFSMEYVKGQTFEEILSKKGFLRPNDAVRIISEVTIAVGHAHRNGITHRDIKPSNIMMSYKGAVKLMDFGVALSETAPRVTADGAIVGTPEYMSPEQAAGEKATALCDIYALGIVLYELLTGTVPFEADTPLKVIKKIQTEEPLPPRLVNPRIPVKLEKIVLRMIAKDPGKRYQSCREILDELARLRTSTSLSVRTASQSAILFSNPTFGIVLTVLFVILILGGIAYLGKSPPESVSSDSIPPHAESPEPTKSTDTSNNESPEQGPFVPTISVKEPETMVPDISMVDTPEETPQRQGADQVLGPPIDEAQESARRKLHELEIPYTAEEFFNRVKHNDASAASLFLAGGVNPDMRDEDGKTAVILAAINGNTSTLELLLDNNADINAKDASGFTAIMHGARFGHSEVVRILLDRGADITTEDKSGMTALMLAAQEGFPEVVRALLEHGANGNAKNTLGKTALMIATLKGHTEIARILLDSGADVDARDSSGMTALMLAAREGFPEVVKVLLEHGADVNARDAFEITPLAWAELRDRDKIALLLKEAGAQE